MALGSTQPLTEMCTVKGKGGLRVRLTTLPPSCATAMKSGNLNFLEPSGPLQACNGTTLIFFFLRVPFPPRRDWKHPVFLPGSQKQFLFEHKFTNVTDDLHDSPVNAMLSVDVHYCRILSNEHQSDFTFLTEEFFLLFTLVPTHCEKFSTYGVHASHCTETF